MPVILKASRRAYANAGMRLARPMVACCGPGVDDSVPLVQYATLSTLLSKLFPQWLNGTDPNLDVFCHSPIAVGYFGRKVAIFTDDGVSR